MARYLYALEDILLPDDIDYTEQGWGRDGGIYYLPKIYDPKASALDADKASVQETLYEAAKTDEPAPEIQEIEPSFETAGQ